MFYSFVNVVNLFYMNIMYLCRYVCKEDRDEVNTEMSKCFIHLFQVVVGSHNFFTVHHLQMNNNLNNSFVLYTHNCHAHMQ